MSFLIGRTANQFGRSRCFFRSLLEDIWRMEIEPYLEEYFFDRRPKVEALRWDRVRERLATSP